MLGFVTTLYTYDNNGNTLAAMKDGTLVYSYTYGLFGTQDSYTSNAVQYTYYTYRPDGLRHSIGNTVHVWDGANIVADVEGNDITTYFRGINLIYAEEDGDITFYHFNAHGDVVVLTNESGEKEKTYSYTSFGIEYNPNTFDTNPFRYCGEYYDAVSGTIYLRARYYNAELGRFTQEDPIRDGRNWYSYCDSNPVNAIDPSGYVARSCFSDETDYLDSPDMKSMGIGGGGRVAPITSPYDSTSYSTYMARSNVAMYDASLGGYYSGGISSATANPNYYALYYQPTVGDNPATNEPWMEISTGRSTPENLQEQMVMNSVKENPQKGKVIIESLRDTRLPPGTQKMQQVNYSLYGNKVTIHYDYSVAYAVYFDFKIVP